jgi:hypothetical protein
VASPRCASSVRDRDVTTCACRVFISDVQATTSASALRTSTPPATHSPPSMRVACFVLRHFCFSFQKIKKRNRERRSDLPQREEGREPSYRWSFSLLLTRKWYPFNFRSPRKKSSVP